MPTGSLNTFSFVSTNYCKMAKISGMDSVQRAAVNKVLDCYYHQKTQLRREETKERVEIVMPIVDRILHFIHEEDDRFSSQPARVGSYWQGLKTVTADEFDFTVYLSDVGPLETVPHWDRFYHSTLNPSDFKPGFESKGMPTAGTYFPYSKDVLLYIASLPWSRRSTPIIKRSESDRITVSTNTTVRGNCITAPLEDYGKTGATDDSPTKVVKSRHSLPPAPAGHAFVNIFYVCDQRVFNPDYMFDPPLVVDPHEWHEEQSRKNGHRVWNDPDLMVDGDIVPLLVRDRLRELIAKAIVHLNLTDVVELCKGVHGPAITAKFKIMDTIVSCDFAAGIKANLSYKDNSCYQPGLMWPTDDKVKAVTSIGYNYVAKLDYYWLASFAEGEKELIRDVDKDGGCRKKTHRIMKTVNAEFWCNTNKPVISSYILKNVWFWEMDRFSEAEHWTNDKMATRFLSMTKLLLERIKLRNMAQYLMQKINLLGGKNEEELDIATKKIEHFLSDPTSHLQAVLDEENK